MRFFDERMMSSTNLSVEVAKAAFRKAGIGGVENYHTITTGCGPVGWNEVTFVHNVCDYFKIEKACKVSGGYAAAAYPHSEKLAIPYQVQKKAIDEVTQLILTGVIEG